MYIKPIDTFFDNYTIDNGKKNSTRMNSLCQNTIMFKYGIKGYNYCGISKNKALIPAYNKRILNFLESINGPIYEVLHKNTKTKIYFDCEFDNVEKEKMNERWNLYLKLDNILKNFLIKNNINNNNILYMDASRRKSNNKYKISLHIIVNNSGVFENRNILKNFINTFKETLPNDFVYNNISFIDNKVYNIPQLFKFAFSPCKDDPTLLKPFLINNNNINYLDKLYASNNFTNFLIGDYINDKKILDKLFPQNNIKENIKILEINKKPMKVDTGDKIPNWKINWIENNNLIKNIYKIRNIDNQKVNLNRIIPSFCKLCKREHENENGFCIVEKNNIIFYCGRNNKGIVIGSWYRKEDINNVDNEKIRFLNEKINELNNEINLLKNNYNIITINNKKLREELNNVLNNKNIKYNRKVIDISTDMWNKYYTLGFAFLNGGWENIIGSWKERNVSKLKNRCFRILKYIDLLKSKNIKNNLSLRKIFNLKNYEFDQLLSSL